ncbi:MAG: DUF4493 domain-containing protein, partial [Muribaculaceae bacterium]|nr:DUF4493 domain-containing protein [Muribaculaceae bacterium]
MKSLKYYISLLSVVALASCNDEAEDIMKGGKLFMDASYIGEVEVVEVKSRAGESADEPVYSYNLESLKNSTIIWISSGEGVVRKYTGLSTMPSKGLQLAGGEYLAEAWAGDSVSASWSARYYKAAEPFMINGDTQINLRLTLANVFASVVIDKSIDAVLSDYQVTISHSRGSCTFVGKDTRVASFVMPTNHKAKEGESPKEETLKWKMTGTEITGDRFVKEGTINYVAEGHQYILTFSHNGGVAAVGGALIALDLQDLDLITNNNTVAQPPTIQGEKGASLSDPILVSRGKCNNDIIVEIGAVGQFKVVELYGDLMSSLIGSSGEKINLVEAGDAQIQMLKGKGIERMFFREDQTEFYNPELNLSSMKISFSKTMINNLDNGTYEIGIKVEDNGGGDNSDDKSKHRISDVTLTIVVSEEIISVRLPENFDNPKDGNVTPTTLRIPAMLMDETAQFSNPALEYRVAGSESSWSRVEPTLGRAAGDYVF